jgi:hypothetical protein
MTYEHKTKNFILGINAKLFLELLLLNKFLFIKCTEFELKKILIKVQIN